MSTDNPEPATPTNNNPQPTTNQRGLWTALKESTFRSLRHRNYRLYFYGQIVSFVGSWMQSAALMWLLYDRTGDPRWPSWLLVAQVGPTVLLGTWGGGIADRFPKRRVILATQAAFLVNAIVLTLLISFHLAIPGLVLGLMVLNGMIQAVDLPARLAFVPDLVPKEDLVNAVGLNSLLFNSARAIGPALAGLVFLFAKAVLPWLPEQTHPVTFGAALCFGLNAASFVAVLIALSAIEVPGDAKRRKEGASAWEGFRYLWQNPKQGWLVLLTFIICIFGWPLVTILPAFTRLQLGQGEETYSLLISMVGFGALIGALVTATFATGENERRFLLLGGAAATVGLFAVSQADSGWFAAIGCSTMGFGLILYLSTGQSTLQLAVPDDKRGRVMALWAMTLSASAPFGHLLAGQAITEFGVVNVLMGMAVGVGVPALLLPAVAKLRRQNRDSAAGDAAASKL